jgi:hypothetical protein
MIMAIDRTIRVQERIAAPAPLVWARVSDHEATPSWIPKVASVRLLEKGQVEPGGVGAVREVAFRPRGWSKIRERITEHRPREKFHYVLFAGMPGLLAHEGRVLISPDGAQASLLRWEVDFRFRSLHWFRPLVPSFLRQFEGVLREGMSQLKQQLESR